MNKALCVALLFCSFHSFSQDRLFPYFDGSKWGLTNESLAVLATPQFDTSFTFNYNKIAAARKDRKWGVIDKTGKTLVPFNYQYINLGDKLAFGRLNNKTVIISLQTGKQVVPESFDVAGQVCDCTDNIVIVGRGGKFGYANPTTGKVIGKIEHDEAYFLRDIENRGIIKSGNKSGVIDLKTGVVIIKPAFNYIYVESKNGQQYIKAGNSKEDFTLFDKNGKALKKEIKKDEQGVSMADEGTEVLEEAKMSEDRQDGGRKDLFVYNLDNGNWKITLEVRSFGRTNIKETHEVSGYSSLKKLYYEDYQGASPARIKAVKDGKAGIIDETGRVLVPFQYDDIFNYEGYYRTTTGNKSGIINQDMKELKKPVIKNIITTDYGLNAWLIEMPGGQVGYMDRKSGKIFIPGIEE